MEIKILAPEEYGLLDAIPAPDAVKLDPVNTWVAVAMKDGKIIGRLVALSLPHFEAAWVAPEHRGGTAGARMEKALTEKMTELGATLVMAYATDAEMESYLTRLGYTRLATVWRKDISCLL